MRANSLLLSQPARVVFPSPISGLEFVPGGPEHICSSQLLLLGDAEFLILPSSLPFVVLLGSVLRVPRLISLMFKLNRLRLASAPILLTARFPEMLVDEATISPTPP
jgi:hypothetical protein